MIRGEGVDSNIEHQPSAKLELMPNDSASQLDLSAEKTNAPRVFISYSWDSLEHKLWVRSLATALVEKGIQVTLDHWHLKLGMDAPLFMTRSIVDSDFVLVICTPEYAARTTRKSGGVRFENMIITGDLIEDMDTTKFIPVLRRGEWGSTSVPRWLTSRSGVDLRNSPYDPEQFQKLLGNLHGHHPELPELGTKPDFEAPNPVDPEIATESTKTRSSLVDLKEGFSPLNDYLNPKEQELLWNAAKDSGGQIAHVKAISGERLSANGNTFPQQLDARSKAEWFGALKSLVRRGLLEGVGYDADFYRLTQDGWAMHDALGEFKRWDVKEVTIERRYISKHDTDTATLACTGVVLLAEEYSEDRQSLYEPHSLFLEGVSQEALQHLTWDPTYTSFTDSKTGLETQFRIQHGAKKGTRTLRLPIDEMPGTRYD